MTADDEPAGGEPEADPTDDENWGRYGVGEGVEEGLDDEHDGGGSVFGPRPDESAIEVVAGDPDLENAVFVALGVLVALVLVLELVGVI